MQMGKQPNVPMSTLVSRGPIRSGGSRAVASALFTEDRADNIEEVLLSIAKDGDVERLGYLLQRYQTDPVFNLDAVDKATGNSAIIWAAKRGNGSIVKMLLQSGCDATILNLEQQSAMDMGSTAVRRIILEDASKSSAFSYRLLLQASWLGSSSDVRRLLHLAPSPLNTDFVNADGFNAIQLAVRDVQKMKKITDQVKAVQFNPVLVLRELLQFSFNSNQIGPAKELKAALHYAAASISDCNNELVQILLHSGGDPGIRDCLGYTPLHYAAKEGNCSVIRLLRENGASVDEKGMAGSTPLHLSSTFAREEAVVLLIELGANPRAIDNDCHTPIDVSRSRRIKFILEGKSPRSQMQVDTRSSRKPVSAGNAAMHKTKEVVKITRSSTCLNIFQADGPSESLCLVPTTPSIFGNRQGPICLSYSNNFREVSNIDLRGSRSTSGNRSGRASSNLWKSSPTTPISPGTRLPHLPRVGSGKLQYCTGVDLNSSVPFITRNNTQFVDQRYLSRSNGDLTFNQVSESFDLPNDVLLQGRTSSKTCIEDIEDDMESGVSNFLNPGGLFPPKEDLRTIHEANEESGNSFRASRKSSFSDQKCVVPPITSEQLMENKKPPPERKKSEVFFVPFDSAKQVSVPQDSCTDAPVLCPIESSTAVKNIFPPTDLVIYSPAEVLPVTTKTLEKRVPNRAIAKKKLASNRLTSQKVNTTARSSDSSILIKDTMMGPKPSAAVMKNKITVLKTLEDVNTQPSSSDNMHQIKTSDITEASRGIDEPNVELVKVELPKPTKMIRTKTNVSIKVTSKSKSAIKPSFSTQQEKKSVSTKENQGKAKSKQPIKTKPPGNNNGNGKKKVMPNKNDENVTSTNPKSLEGKASKSSIISGIGWHISTDTYYDDDFEECDSGECTPTNLSPDDSKNTQPIEMDIPVRTLDITEKAIKRFRQFIEEKDLDNFLNDAVDEDITEEIEALDNGSTFTLEKPLFGITARYSIAEDDNDGATLRQIKASTNEQDKVNGNSNIFLEGDDTVFKQLDMSSIRSSTSSALSEMSEMLDFNGGKDCPNWSKGDRLGHGSFGTVYRGLTDHGTMIAVKEIVFNSADDKTKTELMKIQEEIDILKNLKHENVVQYLGTDMSEDLVQIFMEFVPGGSLANLLSKFGAIRESIFRRYTRQLVEGVFFLHQNNVIHRDIKGANVMLTQNGIVKLIDFGCAKRLEIHLSSSTSQQMSMKGSPYWMAPEVIRETGHGKKSDIWSLGCTVFEMATSKPPWGDLPRYAALFAIGNGDEPTPCLSPNQFSESACLFVGACMTRTPSERSTIENLRCHQFIATRKTSRTSRLNSDNDFSLQ